MLGFFKQAVKKLQPMFLGQGYLFEVEEENNTPIFRVKNMVATSRTSHHLYSRLCLNKSSSKQSKSDFKVR